MNNKKPLNILFLPGDTYPAFRSKITELYEKEMAARGHRIHHVMLSEKIDKQVTKLSGNNIHHLVPTSKSDKFQLIKDISDKVIKEENIDIIQSRDHIHLSKISGQLSGEHGIPFAFHMTTLFHSLDKDLIKQRKSIGNLLRYIRGIRNQRKYKKIIDGCDLFLPISKGMEEHYRTQFPDKKMLPLPLQAPHEFIHYDSKRNKKPNTKKRLIYIGQISYIRNMNFMIDVLNELPTDVELMLVGPPQQEFVVKDMKKHAKKLGVEDRVVFIGSVDKSEIPKYITSAHVGISAIPPLEAFKMSSPTKVVEYLSLGVPVVANKEIEDQRYVIEKSGGGFAVKYDVENFAKAVDKLLSDRETREKMGGLGKKWIRENRNYKQLAEKLEKAYYETIRSFH